MCDDHRDLSEGKMDKDSFCYTCPEIAYVDGALHVEDVNLCALALDPNIGTPVYVYSTAIMKQRYDEFRAALRSVDPNAHICFAVKALSNQSVLERFASWNA